ncbi:MAG: hypothetical protein WAT41_08810 [Flavobacteriales bacterium]
MTLGLPDTWRTVEGDEAKSLVFELEREICSAHKIFGLQTEAIARMLARDNFLFTTNSHEHPYVVVHLTWSVETKPDWPWFTTFTSFDDFKENWQRIYD